MKTEEDILEDLMREVEMLKIDEINDELIANDILKSAGIEGIKDILKHDNLAAYLPPTVIHTETFREKVLDKVLSATIPTGIYTVTMRKLLKLPFRELQDQARLLEIDTVDKDEIELAKEIITNLKEDSPINDILGRRLMKNDMTQVFGVEIQIVRDQKNPSAYTSVHITHQDLSKSTLLTKKDLDAECRNQGIITSRNDSLEKLALRLISHLQISPDRVRLPLTKPFEDFLLSKLDRNR